MHPQLKHQKGIQTFIEIFFAVLFEERIRNLKLIEDDFEKQTRSVHHLTSTVFQGFVSDSSLNVPC